MSRYRPLSIREERIELYLNRTAQEHYDNDFKKFVRLVLSGMSVTGLCQAMNVHSRNSMYNWLKVLKEQHGIERPTKQVEHST